ncbi:hypothetical protein JB92DRAFT_3111204 [Gautieria morchelliformis]|nr:hypothetical protein JB92DRAFT_3111204 [Gautieria morchelliformis]
MSTASVNPAIQATQAQLEALLENEPGYEPPHHDEDNEQDHLSGLQQVSKPATYATITTIGTVDPTLDALFGLILTHHQAWIISREILALLVSGMDYAIMRAGEARAIDSLNHWQDGCQLLDTITAVAQRVLFEVEGISPLVNQAAAAATRSSAATAWGFNESNRLYILYILPPPGPLIHRMESGFPSPPTPTGDLSAVNAAEECYEYTTKAMPPNIHHSNTLIYYENIISTLWTTVDHFPYLDIASRTRYDFACHTVTL